jgi:protein-S-isoprenylcysteine O-methyltransferase Ste14
MSLRDKIDKHGSFLFRWRSYLPLLTLPLFIIALSHSERIKRIYGDSADNLWGYLCIVISFFGLFVRVLVAGYVPRGTSGRNTKWQAAETLNTTGMYSIVRNPLYLGNFIIVLGILLFVQAWWLVVMGAAGFWYFYSRIVFTEEEFLRKKFGTVFLEWREKTPLFWPRFKNWKKSNIPFSFKTALRREFSTLFSIVAPFTFLDITAGFLSKGKLVIKPFWAVFFTAGLLIYMTLLILKKKTKMLNVEGR